MLLHRASKNIEKAKQNVEEEENLGATTRKMTKRLSALSMLWTNMTRGNVEDRLSGST